MDYSLYLEAAKCAAYEAGQALLHRLGSSLDVRSKSSFDFVTEMDEQSETIISSSLLRAFPGHRIMGEEEVSTSGLDETSFLEQIDEDCYLWVVDALDGTTNYIRTIPQFCVSIALIHRRRPVVGVVYNPVSGELFSACLNHGATLNGKPIHVSDAPDPAHSIFGMGFPAAELDKRALTMKALEQIHMDFISMRVYNCAALLLCYVACGRLDISFEMGIHLWDMAGGAVIVTEAGGTITCLNGKPFSIFAKDNIASNGKYHRQFCEKLNAAM